MDIFGNKLLIYYIYIIHCILHTYIVIRLINAFTALYHNTEQMANTIRANTSICPLNCYMRVKSVYADYPGMFSAASSKSSRYNDANMWNNKQSSRYNYVNMWNNKQSS